MTEEIQSFFFLNLFGSLKFCSYLCIKKIKHQLFTSSPEG